MVEWTEVKSGNVWTISEMRTAHGKPERQKEKGKQHLGVAADRNRNALNIAHQAHNHASLHHACVLGGIEPSNTPPQARASPNAAAKCFTFMLGNAFVNASAIISSVGQ